MRKYLKYYFLEKYLFGEVKNNFQKKGYLMPKEFLAIVIWKRNASKTKIIRGIKATRKTIRQITQKINRLENREDKLRELLKIKNIGIAIASAILAVLYSKEFTIIDYRVMNSLKDLKIKIGGNPDQNIKDYLEYIDICKKEAKKNKLSLRDFDRALWARDFYKGRNGLKEISINIK